MTTWSVVVGETSTNLVKNPVFGGGTTGWTTVNGTLATNTTAANLLFGATAGYYSGTGLAANSGIVTLLDGTAGAVTGYVSAWVKGTAPAKFGVYDGAWVYSGTPTAIETGPNGYTRYGASFSAADMSGVTYIGVFWSGTVASYIGGVQCEQSSSYTTQIAGDLGPGYVWTATEHASSSVRYLLDPEGRTTWGGAIVALDDGASVSCEGMVGVGLLPVEVEKLAVAGEVQNLFVDHALTGRDIQLALFVNGASLAATHALRAAVLGRLPYGREVWLRYHAANATLQLKAALAGSFDPNLDATPFGQKTGLHFTALDPRFTLIGPERTTLTLSASPASSYVQARTDKDGWGNMDAGLWGPVTRLVRLPDGTLYLGTTSVGGTAKVQKWVNGGWADVMSLTGSLTGGPVVTDMVYVSNSLLPSYLYVLGDFTAVNGSSSTGLAGIDLTNGAVGAVGTAAAGGAPIAGRYDPVYDRLYIVGAFTSWSGVANTNYTVYFDFVALAWKSLGATRPLAGVYALTVDAQGNVVLGGAFTDTFPLANMSATTAALAAGGAKQETHQWYYRVVARDSAGGLTTGVDSSTLTATATSGSATVSWSVVTGATGYRLFVCESTLGSSRRLPGGAGSTWTAVVDLPAGTLSYYDDGTAYLAALRTAEHVPPTGNSTGDYGARIVKYVGATGAWERMAQKGGGFNGAVTTLAQAGHGGTLIAGGAFTQVDGVAVGRVAYTRGKRWLPLGSTGMADGQVNRLVYDKGRVWAAGSFTRADGDSLAALVARLDGFPTGGWTHTDVALTVTAKQLYGVLPLPYRLLLVGNTTYASAAGGTSVAYTGTANLYPRFHVTGPGVLRWIENGLTKARLVLNYTLQAGERLVIDCEQRTVTSTLRGDVTHRVHPSSHLDRWYLVAGQTQTVWVHMTGTTAASGAVLEGYRALLTGDV
jgi:hypothetical protein